LLVGDGIAVAADHRGNLGVEERLRDHFPEVPDDLEILPGRVKDLHHRFLSHQVHEGLEVEPGRERVN
jgi:hypothetical protein